MKEFRQLQIWERSHQLILSHDRGYLPGDQFGNTSTELVEFKRMLDAFMQKLRANR